MSKTFGDWLAKEILRRRQTWRGAAKEMGVTHTAMARWIYDKGEPANSTIAGIAKWADVDRRFIYSLLGRLEGAKPNEVTEEEIQVLRAFRRLRLHQRSRALIMIHLLCDEPEDDTEQEP